MIKKTMQMTLLKSYIIIGVYDSFFYQIVTEFRYFIFPLLINNGVSVKCTEQKT
jgi:hypothetical protein